MRPVIYLAFIVCFVISSATSAPPSEAKKNYCSSIRITSETKDPKILNRYAHCNVIEGSVYIEDQVLFKNASLPSLVEVTDYVAIHDVGGFHSLSTLLPSLTVIRGRNLYEGYGLALDGLCSHEFCASMDQDGQDPYTIDIKAISEWSLLKVLKGGIWIQHNQLVCLKDEEYFRGLVTDEFHNDIFFNNNLDYCPLIYCTPELCGETPKSCEVLKQGCPYKEANTELKCHRECIQACQKANDRSSCVSCRHFDHKGVCVKQCPAGTLEYFDYRCISHDQCHRKKRTVFLASVKNQRKEPFGQLATPLRDECVTSCPNGFVRKQSESGFSCQIQNASDTCPTTVLETGFLGNSLRYCHTIDGDLQISITNMKSKEDIDELAANLANLRVITGRLRVINAHVFYSLQFLNRLHSIGSKFNHSDSEGEFSYALFILNNDNLREIFTSSNSHKLIINGPSLINFNDRLCTKEIEAFKDRTLRPKPRQETFLYQHNGQKAQCSDIETKLFSSAGMAYGTLLLSFFHKHCGNTDIFIIGYNVHFREAPGNATFTKYEGRQACSSFGDPWSIRRIDLGEGGIKGDCYTYNLTGLSNNKRYAVYIESFGLVEDQTRIVSDIAYASTYPERPECPRELKATYDGDDLFISFKPPGNVPGQKIFYEAKVEFMDQMVRTLALRNSLVTESNFTCEDFERKLFAESLVGTEIGKCTEPNREPAADNCLCEPELPPLSYYRNKNEIVRLINKNVKHHSKEKGTFYKQSFSDCKISPSEASSCSPERDWKSSDFSHDSLLYYGQRETEDGYLDQIFSPNGQIRVKIPTDSFKYKVKIKIRSVLQNLTDCANFDLPGRCGIASEFALLELKPPRVAYVDHFEATKLTPLNKTSEDDHILYNISFDVPDNKKDSIIAYKILFGISNSTAMKSECISSIDQDGVFRSSYEIALPMSSGNYSIILLPLTLLGSAQEIATSTQVSLANIGTIVAIAIAVCVTLLILILVTRKIYTLLPGPFNISLNPYYRWHTHHSQSTFFPRDSRLKEYDTGSLTIYDNEKIDQGNFGRVLKGKLNTEDGIIEVAVKVLKINDPRNEEVKKLFREELEIAQLVQSPFIANLLTDRFDPRYGICAIFDLYYGDLKKYMNKTLLPEDLTQDLVSEILVQISLALEEINKYRIVHRDIAARNILVVRHVDLRDEVLHVKLCDFGLARRLNENGYYRQGKRTGGKSPTPLYHSPPEIQKDGDSKHTHNSDIYGYGVLACEIMNVGKDPYEFKFKKYIDEGFSQNADKAKRRLQNELSEGFIYPFEEQRQENKSRCPIVYDVIMECVVFEGEQRLPLHMSRERLLPLTRPIFKRWLAEKLTCHSLKTDNRKDSESTESGYGQSSSLSQAGDEDDGASFEDDHDERNLCAASPEPVQMHNSPWNCYPLKNSSYTS